MTSDWLLLRGLGKRGKHVISKSAVHYWIHVLHLRSASKRTRFKLQGKWDCKAKIKAKCHTFWRHVKLGEMFEWINVRSNVVYSGITASQHWALPSCLSYIHITLMTSDWLLLRGLGKRGKHVISKSVVHCWIQTCRVVVRLRRQWQV